MSSEIISMGDFEPAPLPTGPERLTFEQRLYAERLQDVVEVGKAMRNHGIELRIALQRLENVYLEMHEGKMPSNVDWIDQSVAYMQVIDDGLVCLAGFANKVLDSSDHKKIREITLAWCDQASYDVRDKFLLTVKGATEKLRQLHN